MGYPNDEHLLAEQSCEKPCHPDSGCPICAEYWDRMRHEEFWKDGSGWTEKARREWVKVI